MVAVDSLVHAFLHRTGLLRRFRAEHAYGPACYRPDGCEALIRLLAVEIDARRYEPTGPSTFPRFLQAAVWSFCATGERNICNGVQIKDRVGCHQPYCPVAPPLHGCAALGSEAESMARA